MTTTDGPDNLLGLIRAARVRDLWPDLPPPSEAILQRLMDACPRLPEGLAAIVLSTRDGDPRPGEIWRAGRAEAVLVWVRRVFDDGVADVVPLVLDVDMADDESVIVPASATTFQMELAAMVSLRTHVDFDAFINRFGVLDIRADVDEVMAAVRDGRHPRGVHVGPPIVEDWDRRIDYRCAVRDLLAGLSPGEWPGP